MTGTWPSYAYTPALDYNGSDSFKYTVTDRGDPDNCEGGPPTCSSRVASAEATVSITVYPVNDQPSASGQTITTNGGAAKLITLTGSDVETAPANFSATITQAPAHGTLTGAWPTYTYTPALEYTGSDSFTFTVTDRSGSPSPRELCGGCRIALCRATGSAGSRAVSWRLAAASTRAAG